MAQPREAAAPREPAPPTRTHSNNPLNASSGPVATTNSVDATVHGSVYQVGRIDELHYHRPSEPTPRQLPRPVHAFVNQSGPLAQIEECYQRGQRIMALIGMGGVGKTALAVHWLTTHADEFPDGMLYAHLGGDSELEPADPSHVAGSLLEALGVTRGRIAREPAERFKLLRSVLAERRAALLLDGAISPEQVLPLLPGHSQTLVMITSTRDLSSALLDYATFLELAPWPRQSAGDLLETLLASSARPLAAGQAETLLGACAGVPLAIRIAAGRARKLAGQPRRLADYLRDVVDEGRRLSALAADTQSMAAVIDCAYRQLTPIAARLYRALGRLPIPQVNAAMTAAALGVSLHDADPVLDELVEACLLETPGDDHYRLHDLIRLHAATQPEDPMTRATQLLAIAQYLITGLKQAELVLTPSHAGHLPSPDADALPEEIRPRLEDEAQALTWCRGHADDTATIIRACAARDMHAQVFQLTHLKWPIYLRLGSPRIEELDLALTAARELGDEYVAMIQTGRGALAAEGRYDEAVEALREAEAIYARLGDRRGRAQALNSIGKIYRYTGRFDEAWQAHEAALGLRRGIGYTRGVGLSTHDLGRVAVERGEFQSALALFEEAAHILVEALPEEGKAPDLYDGGLATVWAARCMGELGQSSAALDQLQLAEQGMIERGSIQGQATAAETAGHVYEAAGDRENAIASYRKAEALFEESDGQGVTRVRVRLAELAAD